MPPPTKLPSPTYKARFQFELIVAVICIIPDVDTFCRNHGLKRLVAVLGTAHDFENDASFIGRLSSSVEHRDGIFPDCTAARVFVCSPRSQMVATQIAVDSSSWVTGVSMRSTSYLHHHRLSTACRRSAGGLDVDIIDAVGRPSSFRIGGDSTYVAKLVCEYRTNRF